MFSRHQLLVLSLLTIFLTLAQANWFDSNIFGRQNEKKSLVDPLSGINSVATGLVGGLLGTGSSASSTSSSSDTAKTTSSSSIPASTPASTSSSSSTQPSSTSSSKAAPSSTSSSDSPSTTTQPPQTSSSASVDLVTVVSTVSGSTYTSVSSSTDSSATSKATNAASLSGNETVSSGMSTKTKNTVIGVVVGVGGAIVLAGLFVVAWRIWGRRKNEDESDGLMGFRSGSAGHEKSASVSGAGPANPFQSTLENYHNPAKQVNASSNF